MDPAGMTLRDAYSYWHTEKVRFSDTDMIGHVNNVAFAAFIESGRVAFVHSGVIRRMPPELLVVMARIEIDYRAELHWPADIDVGSRLLRIGTKSFAVASGVFHGPLCAATSVTTLVVINRATRQSTAIPDEVRADMETYLNPGAHV
jgi:acyl-CoA thioester hydrolase